MTRFGHTPTYPALRQGEAYWSALRESRLLPDRSDIDPRGLEDALDATLISERIAPGVARMRIAGSLYSDVLGMEARGMTMNAMFLPEDRAVISGAIDICCDDPAQVVLNLRAPGAMGRPELTGQLLLLPLRSDLGDVSRILGVIGLTGQIGRTPRRFVVESTQVTPLTPAWEAPLHSPSQAAVGFAEETASFQPAKPKLRASRIPFLRVVEKD